MKSHQALDARGSSKDQKDQRDASSMSANSLTFACPDAEIMKLSKFALSLLIAYHLILI